MYKILGSDGNEYGPVSAEQITKWIAESRVEKKTPVKPEGAPDWVFLQSLPEFTAAFAPPAPPGSLPAPLPGPPPIAPRPGRPAKNLKALVAATLGIFSMVPPVGAVLGIPAVVLGISGLGFYQQNPASGGKVHAWIGIIFGGLFAVGYWVLITAYIISGIVPGHPTH